MVDAIRKPAKYALKAAHRQKMDDRRREQHKREANWMNPMELAYRRARICAFWRSQNGPKVRP